MQQRLIIIYGFLIFYDKTRKIQEMCRKPASRVRPKTRSNIFNLNSFVIQLNIDRVNIWMVFYFHPKRKHIHIGIMWWIIAFLLTIHGLFFLSHRLCNINIKVFHFLEMDNIRSKVFYIINGLHFPLVPEKAAAGVRECSKYLLLFINQDYSKFSKNF